MKARFIQAILIAALSLTACDFITGPSKVASGQLYQSGDGKYDPYFDAVHKEQLAAANWGDESKAARKPIITALTLPPNASNSTIISATKEKKEKGEGNLGPAIQETSVAEVEFAKKMLAQAERLDEMQKKGEELKKQAAEDRRNMGADKADEKKVEKKDEIKREIAAAVDVVGDLASDARKNAKEAEDLVAKLKAAWDSKDDDEPKKKPDKKDDDKKEEKKSPPPPPPKPKPEKKPDVAKPDVAKPAATQKPPEGEVFNP